MSDTPGLDKLREHHRKLGLLLDDPHPDLLTWRMELLGTLTEIADYAVIGNVRAFPALLEACGDMASIGGSPKCAGAVFFECARDAARAAYAMATECTSEGLFSSFPDPILPSEQSK